MGRQPSITIRTAEALALNTFGLAGTAQGVTDSVVYFRKKDEGGTVVANATEEHISFTVDEGIITVDDVTGPHGDILGSQVVITPTYDGTNAIMAIDTTAAIA